MDVSDSRIMTVLEPQDRYLVELDVPVTKVPAGEVSA